MLMVEAVGIGGGGRVEGLGGGGKSVLVLVTKIAYIACPPFLIPLECLSQR